MPRLVILLLAAFTLGGLAPTQLPAAATAGRPPNIIFVLTDDQTAAEFSFMPQTQRLIVEQGVTLPNFFVTVSLCCPARSTILRGQYAHNHGVLTNSEPNGGYSQFMANDLEASNVATWLQAQGYRTGLFGKYLNGYPSRGNGNHVPPGWDTWYAASGNSGYAEFNYTLNENGTLVRYGATPEDYLVDVLASRSTEFVRQASAAGTPFFAYIAPQVPHLPSTPAPRHQGLFPDMQAPRGPAFDEADVSDKPAYIRNRPPLGAAAQRAIDANYRQRLQSLQSVDDLVASLVQTLEATGQIDNTYIFVTSDNGFMQGQHRLRMGKQVPYEESIRVSLMVRGPGVPAGVIRDHLTGNTDFAPTFAAIAGAPLPSFVDGRSLVPLLGAAPPTPSSWRQSFLIEHWLPAEDIEGDRIVLPEYHGVRTAGSVYVEYATGERELYDLVADPYQLQNLGTTTDTGLLAQYATLVADLQRCAAAACQLAEDRPAPAAPR